MTKHILKYLTLTITLLTLAACGGGGGGGNTTTSTAKTTATVKIALNGTLPTGSAIIGATFTLTLPDNVTPEVVNGLVAGSIVTTSGTFAGGGALPEYTEATTSTPGKLVIALASVAADGVTDVGEVATVTLKLANSTEPVANSFTLDQFLTGKSGETITGLSAAVSEVTLQ